MTFKYFGQGVYILYFANYHSTVLTMQVTQVTHKGEITATHFAILFVNMEKKYRYKNS